ncbi:hypothetical protein ACSDR0_15790 [Streptosporangium sp. G11]|uniref:hypothetical protein n=1 Tax=Streptosporangium sp. G11 TaxID=3436926 RepID=UPI003EB7536D
MITRSKRPAVLALGAGPVACGPEEPSGSSGGKTTITFWDDNGGPARTPVWRHVIAESQNKISEGPAGHHGAQGLPGHVRGQADRSAGVVQAAQRRLSRFSEAGAPTPDLGAPASTTRKALGGRTEPLPPT